jgi:hypothetical protein
MAAEPATGNPLPVEASGGEAVAAGDDRYAAAERRIEWRTPVIGVMGAIIVTFTMGRRPGEAVLAGAFLSWLNFRLLRQVVGTLANLATGVPSHAPPVTSSMQSVGEKTSKVPGGSYIKIFGLLVLLLLAAYVMLAVFKLPILPLLGGLLAVVPAILLELVSELTHGGRAPGHT